MITVLEIYVLLFSLAGLGTLEEEEHWLLQNSHKTKIKIGPTKNITRDLYLHIKILTSESMKLEVQSRG